MTATATRTPPDLNQRIADAMNKMSRAARRHADVLATHERGSDAEIAAYVQWDKEIRACAALLREAKAGRAGR